MSLGFYFTPSSFTAAEYDETLSKLEAAGAGAPAGRLYPSLSRRRTDSIVRRPGFHRNRSSDQIGKPGASR